MGLYLAVFDEDQEIEGVEIGSYADFNFFRDAVTATVEYGNAGSVCPVLINHSDCDGEWSAQESVKLIREFEVIDQAFRLALPVEFNSAWKKEVARSHRITPSNLFECFFDVDGEPLLDRLRELARLSIVHQLPILFQ